MYVLLSYHVYFILFCSLVAGFLVVGHDIYTSGQSVLLLLSPQLAFCSYYHHHTTIVVPAVFYIFFCTCTPAVKGQCPDCRP